jgi:preprotein translocase subunit SecG
MGIIIGILNVIISLLSFFLIGIILIQRGKGGGLAGAFGGVGGSSAFGTKAGDVFTKITVGLAIGWIILLMMMVILTNNNTHSAFDDDSSAITKETGSKSSKSKSNVKSSDLKDDFSPGSTEGGLPPDFPSMPAMPDAKSPSSTAPVSPTPPATVPTSPPATTSATPPATTAPASPPAKAPK